MISADYYQKLARVESGDDPLAQNPKSSARGRYQFVSGTAKQYGLDRHDFGTPEYEKAEEVAVQQYTQDNYSYLKEKLNREPTQGELYLAHQQGAGGAEKLLATDQNAKAVDILGRDEVLNNGGTEEMTIAEFSQKWTSKFDKRDGQNGSVVKQSISDDGLSDDANAKGMGKPVDVDAFSDFGVNQGYGDVDAFSDFGVSSEDAFLSKDDGLGGLKKSMIDQSSGAPSYVRQAVGSLYDPTSRLKTLQKYYPDAQPYGGDNFVFTHPETKKPTLYNPTGMDRNDVTSITKEGVVTLGSAAGAALGVAVGAPGGPAAVYGAVVGAGLGAGAASNLWDAWMTITGQTVDVRSLPQVATETTAEVIGGGLGEGIGRALPETFKAGVGGAKATSRAIIAQMAKFDIRPTATITAGPIAGRIEAGLAQNVGAADIMQQQTDEIISQSHAALNKIIDKYGKSKTKEGAGDVIQKAAESAAARLAKKSSDLYDTAYDLVGAQTAVDLQSVSALQKELLGELANAPEAKKRVLGPAIEKVNAIIADAKANGMGFETFRSIRTDIGKDLQDPLSSGATSSQNLAMKRVYAAMSKDMEETAKAAGSEAYSAVKRADKYKKAYETTATPILNKIMKYDAESKAYKFALSASKDGGSSLRKLRKLFTQDEWDEVSATVLSELGQNPASGDFSIAKFVTSYNQLAPEAKAALFKGGKNQEAGEALDEFADLMSIIKDKKRYENTSNTAGAIQIGMVLNSLGTMGAGAAAGDQTGFGGFVGAAGGIIAPRMAAKLITNPAFVKWLAAPVKESTKDWSAHLAKLAVIGDANPEIKEAINYLLLDMQKATTPETIVK